MKKKYDDPSRNTRLAITLALVAGGAIAGAMFGIVLTPLGKIVAGAPAADFANYRWNAILFAIMGAVIAPVATWSALRSIPLWRAIAEPLGAAVAGAAAAMFIGSGMGFLLLPPVCAAAALARMIISQNRKTDRARLRDGE